MTLAAATLAFLLAALPARAEVVVVMSAQGSAGSLSAAQVSQIFLAKSSSLPGGGQAAPIDQDEGTPIRDEFYKKVTGKDAAQLKAYWAQLLFTGKAQKPKKAAGDEAVKKLVAATPGGIGYIDAKSVDGTVKVVLKP